MQTERSGLQIESSMKQFAYGVHQSANWTREFANWTADLRTSEQAAHVIKVDVLRAFDVLAGDAGELTPIVSL